MITNFFRIQLPFESFQVQRVAYSEKHLCELRKEYNKNVSFFRQGEFIYISPRKGAELQLGTLETVKVCELPLVVQSLIRHMVFRTFRESFPDRIPQSFSPLRFFSSKEEHDIVRNWLPDELKGRVCYLRMIEVEARQISESGKPSFGLLIRSRQRWQFRIGLRELIEEGFDLKGRGVLETHPIPGLERVLAPDETLLGEVVAVHGDEVEIMTNDGIVRRKLDTLQMQRAQHHIGDYLAFKWGTSETTRLFHNLRQDQQDRASPGRFFSEAEKFSAWFVGSGANPRLYENDDGFCFTVTSNNEFQGASVPIHRTSLIFDYGPGASSPYPFSGLSSFGPFNAARFERNDLRVLVLFHQQSRGAATQFLKQLIDGIPESKYFKRGFKALFRLSSVTSDLKEVKSYLPEAFEEAIDEAVKNEEGRGFDVALVECPEASKDFPIAENPYYRARARLMSYGIPTQGVRDEHLRAHQSSLEWTLGPMALQIYAKVGGTPWRLPAVQSEDREILVGVGHALERPNLWADAEQSKVVGITTFFLGDGSYIHGERLRSVPYRDYFEELLKALKSSIEIVAQRYGWKDGNTVRIVFHIFKPIKHVEADVVEQLIGSFPQYKILFAFVTISTQHPWMMFRNVSRSQGKTSVTLCERGDNLILDPHNCLLQIRGDNDRPNKKHRPPYPVSIRVHEKSTYKDLKYITQQIHDFAFLSWRSFYPSETPVTVFYSSLLANESNKLKKIRGWNPAFLDKHFRRKQWFL